MSEKTILATVGGISITDAEVDTFIASLPKEQQPYASNPQFRKQCLDQIVNMYLFAKMGEDEKLDETEEFLKLLETAKRELLSHVAMNKAIADVAVTEEEAKEFYEINKSHFMKDATVRAKHILVEKEEDCQAILTSINNGEKTFEDAAKEFSTCPSKAQGGDLGAFGRGQMVKEFEDAAFDAEAGAIVGPVKTQFGYHLIKVEEKNEASVMPFEEVGERIRTNLLQRKQSEVYMAKLAELREKYVSE